MTPAGRLVLVSCMMTGMLACGPQSEHSSEQAIPSAREGQNANECGPNARIFGIVQDSLRQPVASATVALIRRGESSASCIAKSQPNGEFYCCVQPAEYSTTVTHRDYGPVYLKPRELASAQLLLTMQEVGTPVHLRVTGYSATSSDREHMRAIRLSDNAGDVYYCAADIGGDYDCQLPSKYHYRVDLESNAIVSLPIKLKAASSQVPLKAEIRTYAPADVAEGLSVSAVAWIRSNTPESDGRKRWSALSGIAHDTRVIGFGENSHGIADWRIAGLELFQFLVEKHRFNFIALEADFATSIAVNDYVTRGIGNPEELLNELSDWIWNTRETLALIHWMRAYNVGRKPGSQLQIVGVDMQYTQHAVSCARRYLQSVGTRNFQDFDTILGLLTNDDDSAYLSGIDVSAQARALRFVRQLKIRFDAEKTRYERLTGEHKFLVARHCLVVLDQYMRMTGSRDRADARDFWMAENVRWLLDEFDSKSRILFIAHDFHVAKTPNGWSVPAGWHLSSALGNKYFSIGTFFYKGSLRAWDAQQPAVLRSIPSTATADSFMEASLHSVGHPGFLLDFASAKSHPELKSWLRIPHFARIVSADYSSNEASKTLLILEQTFDALLFVDNVHSTTKIER